MITFTITVQLEFMFSIQFNHSKLRVNVVSQLANEYYLHEKRSLMSDKAIDALGLL